RDVALTVIEYDTKTRCFFPLRCDQSDKEFKAILLAVDNHFYAVKNANALLQPSNYRARDSGGIVFCLNCLNSFNSQSALDRHISICGKKKYARLVMPLPDEAFVKFDGGPRTIIAPSFMPLD